MDLQLWTGKQWKVLQQLRKPTSINMKIEGTCEKAGVLFSILPRRDAPGSCWKIFRQNCRSCESLPLPLFSYPAHVSTPAHICPSLTDALSIFSRSKWWGSEILLCPLSIVSPLIILHMLIIERGAQMRPAGTVFFTTPTKACTKYFGRHL